MAFLVCVSFVSMVFPGVTHAATKSSSERFPFPEESVLLICDFLSFASLNLYSLEYDLAFFYIQSSNKPKPPHQAKNGKGSKNSKKNNSSFNGNGNSTSKKPPQGKDDK